MAAVDASVATESGAWAIVFAGGIGSRFWPLSNPRRPKPTLQLLGERTLLADTVARLSPIVTPERTLVMTSSDIASVIIDSAPDVPRQNVLIEPRPLGTAAALAWGLETVRRRSGPDTPVIALHADLTAAFPAEFRRCVGQSLALAMKRRALVIPGVTPTRPETAFGYIVPGAPLDPLTPLDNGGACQVARFAEKPPLDGVVDLLREGALWHSGIVVGPVAEMLELLFRHVTELAPGRAPLLRGNLDDFATKVTSTSVERGLLQRADSLLVTVMDCGWDDVGTWECLRRARELDDAGNGAIGKAHFVDSSSNVVHSEAGTVVLFGCQRMLVVTLRGLTFVTPIEKAADLRALIEQLPPHLRTDPTQ
jgi:mannose-1-phosphate guanylyltransferase